MLGLDCVSISYDGSPAVIDASLQVADGSVVAVLGPSGCGKSTLLRAVAGLERPTAGAITWDGVDLGGVATHKRGFALMFQDGQLFGHLTVARNVGYAPRLRRAPDVAGTVARLLSLVGLEGYGDRLPGTLSGGERSRVLLARVLAGEPEWLLADEPLANLDPAHQLAMLAQLRNVAARGAGVIVVIHDLGHAARFADDALVLARGRVVAAGSVSAVLNPATLATAFGISAHFGTAADGSPVIIPLEIATN